MQIAYFFGSHLGITPKDACAMAAPSRPGVSIVGSKGKSSAPYAPIDLFPLFDPVRLQDYQKHHRLFCQDHSNEVRLHMREAYPGTPMALALPRAVSPLFA